MRPLCYVQLRQLIEARDVEIAVLRGQLEALAGQVAELRLRLGQTRGTPQGRRRAPGPAKLAPRPLRESLAVGRQAQRASLAWR